MTGFYGSVEKDDLNAGHGFADGIDDFVPGVLASSQRRRNSSISSEASDDIGSVRRGSITDRVAGLQVSVCGKLSNYQSVHFRLLNQLPLVL